MVAGEALIAAIHPEPLAPPRDAEAVKQHFRLLRQGLLDQQVLATELGRTFDLPIATVWPAQTGHINSPAMPFTCSSKVGAAAAGEGVGPRAAVDRVGLRGTGEEVVAVAALESCSVPAPTAVTPGIVLYATGTLAVSVTDFAEVNGDVTVRKSAPTLGLVLGKLRNGKCTFAGTASRTGSRPGPR